MQIGGGAISVSRSSVQLAAAPSAAAGLAAACNTPLARVAFVLEELMGDLNRGPLGSVRLGAFVVHSLIEPQTAFLLAAVIEPS